jgi:hypothetical protein
LSFVISSYALHKRIWDSNPNDKPAYLYRRTKRGQQYKLGLDVVYVSGSKLVLNNYHILEYDKAIFYIGEVTALSTIHI